MEVITYCLFLLPRLHGRFVFLKLVTPVGVNFLIVIAFVWWSTSGDALSLSIVKEKERERKNPITFIAIFTLSHRMSVKCIVQLLTQRQKNYVQTHL
jgi:arginine exporter protein ArgO